MLGRNIVDMNKFQGFCCWVEKEHSYLYLSIFQEQKKLLKTRFDDLVKGQKSDIKVKLAGYSKSLANPSLSMLFLMIENEI